MSQVRTIDPRRLLRALGLEVERTAPGRYRVAGGARSHVVLLRRDGPPVCDCVDAHLRPGTVCKHRLALRLFLKVDRPILTALRSVVAGLT